MPSPRAGASSPEGAPDVGMENKSPDLGSEERAQAIPEQLKNNLPGSVSQEAEAGKAGAEQQEPQTARKQPKPKKQGMPKKVLIIQVLVTGQTGGCEDMFLKKVSDRLPKINLKTESFREDSGHFLLVFCPVVSRMGIDMRNALEHLQGESKAILVMLHHRPKEYDHFLDTKLQAQHPAVVHTVHARYTLEDGLYGCQVNKESVATVAKILKVHHKKMNKEPSDSTVKRFLQAQFLMPGSMQRRGNPPNSERQWPKQKPPADRRGQRLEDWEPRKERKWYPPFKTDFPIQVLVTGRIGDCGNEFLQRVSDRLPKINLKTESFREDSGHFLLVFCPVVSRVGTDMQNALKHLQGESKAILVMLHHKPKEYDHFLDTEMQAQHPAVVRTVHARYTLEDGLYYCQENKEAVAAVAKILKVHCKKMTKEPSDPTVEQSLQAQLALPENDPPRGTMSDSASQQAETHRLEKKQKPLVN